MTIKASGRALLAIGLLLGLASVAQAAQSAHQLSARSNVVVHMAPGKYWLTQPLT